MRVLWATVIGIGSASVGFGAGLVGTIVVGPWTGAAYPAVTIGIAGGVMAMMSTFVLTLTLGRVKNAILISH
jgi:hypothetical protein